MEKKTEREWKMYCANNHYPALTYIGLCYSCWVNSGKCEHCFYGKGDGNHLSKHHVHITPNII